MPVGVSFRVDATAAISPGTYNLLRIGRHVVHTCAHLTAISSHRAARHTQDAPHRAPRSHDGPVTCKYLTGSTPIAPAASHYILGVLRFNVTACAAGFAAMVALNFCGLFSPFALPPPPRYCHHLGVGKGRCPRCALPTSPRSHNNPVVCHASPDAALTRDSSPAHGACRLATSRFSRLRARASTDAGSCITVLGA